MVIKTKSLILGVLLILFLNFVIAECGDFICESEEVSSCPSDCEIAIPEGYVPPEVVQDNSMTETIPEETSGQISNETSGELNSDIISEESTPIVEQTNLSADEFSSSLNNLFENPFVLIGGGVLALIIISLIVFLLLRKKKSSEVPQQTEVAQTTQL